MKYSNIYQAGGKTGASYGRRNAPDPPEADPTFWDHVQDVGEFGLNMLATPFETITGVNFYDPEYESEFMQSSSDIGSALIGTGVDMVGNTAAPGLYGKTKESLGSAAQGFGLQDATHGERRPGSFGQKMAGTIDAVGQGAPIYGMGIGQTGGNVGRYQTEGSVSGSPVGQFQGMSPAWMGGAPNQMMPYLQNMYGPQGSGGGQMFAIQNMLQQLLNNQSGQMGQMGQMNQMNQMGQQGSWQNYMGNLGQNSPDPLDKAGIGPMAMTGKAANLGLNIANIWSGKTKTQSDMVREAELALEKAQMNARIKAMYNPTQLKTSTLNPEFLASYKTGIQETPLQTAGMGIDLVERGGRIGKHMRKYQKGGCLECGGNVKAQTGYYGNPDIYGGGLNPDEQYFANLAQGVGTTFGGPAGGAGAQFATGLYRGISDFNKKKILGPGGLRPYMEPNIGGYETSNAAVLANLGPKHKDFQKFAYHLNRLSPENTDILEANRAVTARSQMAQSGGSTEAVEIEVEGGETIKTIDGENNKFTGPSHDQGGINIDANEGDFVYPKGIWAKRHTKRTKREADILAQLEAAGINTEDLV